MDGSGLITSIARFIGFFLTNLLVDGTWSSVWLLILSIVESGTYLIAACLLAYRPLGRYIFERNPLSFCIKRRTAGYTETIGEPNIEPQARSSKRFARDSGYGHNRVTRLQSLEDEDQGLRMGSLENGGRLVDSNSQKAGELAPVHSNTESRSL